MSQLSKKKPRPQSRKSEREASIPEHIQARLEKIWKQAYSAKTQEDLIRLYSDWSESYDEDHEAVGFFGHVTASQLLARHLPDHAAEILDAGAGTGAAGVQLSRLGYKNIVGVDLSAAMLERAAEKKVYKQLMQHDLSLPLDEFPVNTFDAAILVGVFSFGQAPACALEEVIRVMKPGGIIVFTMRTDFFESNAMSVRGKMEELVEGDVWEEVECTRPDIYLPNKDPKSQFRVWAYRIKDAKNPPVDADFADAARKALTSDSPVKRLDHRYIWNSRASRLYNRYIECPEYYLNDCEEEILRTRAEEITEADEVVVELGCGSATKVKHLLRFLDEKEENLELSYMPIDLSPGALEATAADIVDEFGDKIDIKPMNAPFQEALSEIPNDCRKLILFFGSSIGNLETVAEMIDFLKMVRGTMNAGDRFLVGMDLHKDEEVLRTAYEAGEENRSFFLNMVRRMNDELGAGFDLGKFYQVSTYDADPPYKGIQTQCVNLKLATAEPQKTTLEEIGVEVELQPGESIQVGTSRKFRRKDIESIAEHAGLKLRRQWLDERGYFSMNELVPLDIASQNGKPGANGSSHSNGHANGQTT